MTHFEVNLTIQFFKLLVGTKWWTSASGLSVGPSEVSSENSSVVNAGVVLINAIGLAESSSGSHLKRTSVLLGWLIVICDLLMEEVRDRRGGKPVEDCVQSNFLVN